LSGGLSLAAGRRSPLVEVRLRNNRLEASAAGLQTLPGSVVGSDDEVRAASVLLPAARFGGWSGASAAGGARRKDLSRISQIPNS
jgi:hypothetical protein